MTWISNRECFVHQVRVRITPDVRFSWLASIADPELDYALRIQEVIDTIFEQLHCQ